MPKQLNVNEIVNQNGTAAPILSIGATVASDNTVVCLGGVSVTGTLQATSFVGDGAGLTNIPGLTVSKGIAIKRIMAYDEYQA